MPPRLSPTVRQQRVGLELRKMREHAGMTPGAMAAALGIEPPKVSQMESGKSGISVPRLHSWASASKCSNEALIGALAVMVQDRGKRWFDEYRGRLPAGFLDIAEMEHYANKDEGQGITSWGTTYVPGLAQTIRYSEAVFARIRPPLPRHDLESRTAFRVRRQVAVLDGMPYTMLIHEAALRMQFGGPIVLREQLGSILDDSERPNVTVQAIPFDVDTFPGAGENLCIAAGGVPELDTVQIDLTQGPQFIHAESELRTYRAMFADVREIALSPQASRDFILRIMKELKG